MIKTSLPSPEDALPGLTDSASQSLKVSRIGYGSTRIGQWYIRIDPVKKYLRTKGVLMEEDLALLARLDQNMAQLSPSLF